jgi:hypothetical protein
MLGNGAGTLEEIKPLPQISQLIEHADVFASYLGDLDLGIHGFLHVFPCQFVP